MASPATALAPELEDIRFREPLDVQPYIASCPPSNMAKGMFFTCITRLAREKSGQSIGLDHYTAFKSYSFTDWLTLLPQCAQLAYPHLPLRAALYEIAGHIYKTFAESTIGKVVMSVAGRDANAAVRLVTRAYESVGTLGTVRLAEQVGNRSLVEFRDMWEYPDCYQAGVLAAGVRSYGHNPRVRVRVLSLCDVDVELSW